MQISRMPPALRERLGPEAAAGLVDLLNETGKEWTAAVISTAGDRFERRLTDETSKLRVEMAQGFAGVRQEMAHGFAAVRQELASGIAAVRQEMAEQRFELMKWAFLFWVGQFFAVASLIAVLIRFLRPPG